MNNHSAHIRLFLAVLTAIIGMLPLSAATSTDSVSVYFRVGQSQYDPAFDNNGVSMDSFIERLRISMASVDSVVVRGYVSPEGHTINDPLSQKRCDEIARYIISRTGISPDKVKTRYIGVDWQLLRRLVAETPGVPAREKILDVIDNVPVWIYNSKGEIVDGRNRQLARLDAGEPYRWMLRNLFSKCRATVAVSIVTTEDAPQVTMRPEPESTIKPVIIENPEIVETPEHPETPENLGLPQISELPQIADKPDPKPFYMALKSNMLYDAALVPNIGAEFYLGKNLSVTGEWMYAWWDSYNRHRYWRVYGGDLGMRWWFGRKAHEKPLTGHHLGIFAGALTFDFELGDYGYMGGKPGGTLWDRCLVHSGIEYGYSLPITRRLNIDFSIALGFLGGNYIKYFPFDNEYFKQKEYKMRFVGPTKAEVSLVWLIGRGNVNKKGGAG